MICDWTGDGPTKSHWVITNPPWVALWCWSLRCASRRSKCLPPDGPRRLRLQSQRTLDFTGARESLAELAAPAYTGRRPVEPPGSRVKPCCSCFSSQPPWRVPRPPRNGWRWWSAIRPIGASRGWTIRTTTPRWWRGRWRSWASFSSAAMHGRISIARAGRRGAGVRHDLQGADVAMFYYAGHGVQVRGANYLMPVDANPTREAENPNCQLWQSFLWGSLVCRGRYRCLLSGDADREAVASAA